MAKKSNLIKSEKLPTATEVKTNFGTFLIKAQKEAVIFNKNGNKNPVGVLISYEQFQKYQELEESYWLNRVKIEGKEMLGTKKSKETLDSI